MATQRGTGVLVPEQTTLAQDRHHLVDPHRGASTPEGDTTIVGASVVAGTAGWADALSKVPFVVGRVPSELFDVASAFVIRSDGSCESVGPTRFVTGGAT